MLAGTAGAGIGDLGYLLRGVKEITAPGEPGTLAVFGTNAFVVVLEGKGHNRAPVVAAAEFGNGRVVAFGHDGYLNVARLREADTGRLVINAIRWAANRRYDAVATVRVGVYHNDDLVTHLKSHGCAARSVSFADLADVDVLAVNAHAIDAKDVPTLTKFVENGGGLLTAATGWGWAQLNPSRDLANDFPGNQLLAPMGLVWTDGSSERNAPASFAATASPPLLTHGLKAWEAALRQADGQTKLSADESAQASATLTLLVQSLPVNDQLIRPVLSNMMSRLETNAIPRPDAPVRRADLLKCLAVTLANQTCNRAPPEKLAPNPAAKSFPGAVPADAKRGAWSVPVNTKVPAWHSTGLYAAPGELITVEVPESAAGKQLSVRIGAHTDTLWGLDEWERFPEITRSYEIDKPLTKAGNAFGGAIYIDVPERCRLGTVPVTFRGAVRAPLYVHGMTSLKGWRESIRNYPAPWAEIGSSKVILTVPSSAIRKLDDPVALMNLWDKIMDTYADLAALPHDRQRPERYVPDVQISAGYMHSGYPIMTLADHNDILANRAALLKGDWGLFHEMGHNHQSDDWTFDGTGEVTCNLFSMYLAETICGIPKEKAHEAITVENRRRMMSDYFQKGAQFKQWQDDPFLALTMYIQLEEAFGWEPFKKVFATYRALPGRDRPKSDDEKRDQWLVRFSRQVNRNLGPFFAAWGVPSSQAARDSIKDLPAWMPADFPLK